MFSILKSIFHRVFYYKIYNNSSKLCKILYLNNYPEAKIFIENNHFFVTKDILFQWINNVYSTSNGAPIHPQAKEFNEKFMIFVKQQENQEVINKFLKTFQVVNNHLKKFNFNPAILSVSTNNMEFKNNSDTVKVPYSQKNIEIFTKWLIAQCILNQFIENYPHIIELLNQKFNVEDIYTFSNQKSEILKLFVSIFHNQMVEQQNIYKQQQVILQKDNVHYFDFEADFTNLPKNTQILLSKAKALLIDWDWKKELKNNDSFEALHSVEKILNHQISYCIEQYLKMPIEFRETMRNHEILNMVELLEHNLKDIVYTLSQAKNKTMMLHAEQSLFKQTVQKTMMANQRNNSNSN